MVSKEEYEGLPPKPGTFSYSVRLVAELCNNIVSAYAWKITQWREKIDIHT